jgi:prevent-host-death family protein
MAERYSMTDARTSLAAILDKAEAGRRVVLTRRGRAVAVVMSLGEFERLREERRLFAEAYRAFLEKYQPSETGQDARFPPARQKDAGRRVRL